MKTLDVMKPLLLFIQRVTENLFIVFNKLDVGFVSPSVQQVPKNTETIKA